MRVMGVDVTYSDMCGYLSVTTCILDNSNGLLVDEIVMTEHNYGIETICGCLISKFKKSDCDYISLGGFGIDEQLHDELKKELEDKVKIYTLDKKNEHRMIVNIRKNLILENIGMNLHLTCQTGYLRIDRSKYNDYQRSRISSLGLACLAYEDLNGDSNKFNKENIKKIAEHSFTKENWEIYKFHKYRDGENIKRLDMKLDLFTDYVAACLNNKKLIHLTGEWHRGIGKTYFIKNISKKYNIPIVYNLKSLKEIYEGCEGILLDKINNVEPCVVLIDERISFSEIEHIKSLGLTPIGFITTSCKYKVLQ